MRLPDTQFSVSSDLGQLGQYLPAFLEITGEGLWWKRVDYLADQGQQSPFQAKIVLDYHWLELELSHQAEVLKYHGTLIPRELTPQSMASLLFARTVVEVAKRLTRHGMTSLSGRLRDALKTSFAGLYLELDMAAALFDEGFDVTFSDLEGRANFDLMFEKGATTGEMECKSLSADAGRKIHRRDFYRFVDALNSAIEPQKKVNTTGILVITLEDRLLPATKFTERLKLDACRLYSDPNLGELAESGYRIEWQPLRAHHLKTFTEEPRIAYPKLCQEFGNSCHVSGVMYESSDLFVVMRSSKEDDHTKPALDALKKAAKQLSGMRAGIIALQYEDLEPQDLLLPHLRRDIALLDNYVFQTSSNSQLAALYHCAYNGLHLSQHGIGKPAFVFWNPAGPKSSADFPFQTGISNSELARALGVDPATVDPDGHDYGAEFR